MTHWQRDTDLTGVRDPKALEKLPQDERTPWQKLWKDVGTLLAKTQENEVADARPFPRTRCHRQRTAGRQPAPVPCLQGIDLLR
jgi:hypothetical protein